MNRRIVVTEDGSPTIYVPGLKEHYHSIHGALQESRHVFISNGLDLIPEGPLSVLEIGFGTGLNALLTFSKLAGSGRLLYYEAWEKYPLTPEEIRQLDLNQSIEIDPGLFDSIQLAPWNQEFRISQEATIHKISGDILGFRSDRFFDLVYFDAFGPDAQPDLWTEEVFRRLGECMKPGAILSTYSVKGMVRRNLKAAGFEVKKVPGPPGKREITVAFRNT